MEIRLKSHACLLALALPVSVLGCAAQSAFAAPADATQPAASAAAPVRPGGIACPPTPAASRLGAATSKGRHVPDEDDPCAGSHGVARPARSAASSPAQ